tara:strand:- start:77 stop:409 length:333 start_codon:yes stop_codon:yes gene_type:complete
VLTGQVVLSVYGVLLIVGGMMGYVKSKSRASLFAGAISGGLCVGAAWLSVDQPSEGFTVGSLVAFLLAGVFINRFAKTRKIMPAAVVLILSLVVGILLMITQQGLVIAVK